MIGKVNTLTYRSYRRGDEIKICDLFLEGSPHIRTIGYWNWINCLSPFGRSIVEVAEINDKIIGHYAVLPINFYIEGKKINAGLVSQAIVHPSFRNLENIVNITNRVWQQCEEQSIEFVYGFPNNKMWDVKKLLMDWKPVAEFKCLEIESKKITKFSTETRQNIVLERIERFNEKFNELWNHSNFTNSRLKIVSRNAKYLNWRVFGNPLSHYHVYAAHIGNNIVGYIVLKLFRRSNTLYGHVIDILTLDSKQLDVAKTLLNGAFEYFNHANVDIVSMWLFEGNYLYKEILSKGFVADGFETNFGVKKINERADKIYDISDWHISMLDSDAF